MEVQDEYGYTPAHEAACRGCIPLRPLIEAGFDLNTGGHGSCMVLHMALMHWEAAMVVVYLLQMGAEANVQNIRKLTPLALATKFGYGSPEALSSLKKYDAHLEMKNENGVRFDTWTPGHTLVVEAYHSVDASRANSARTSGVT